MKFIYRCPTCKKTTEHVVVHRILNMFYFDILVKCLECMNEAKLLYRLHHRKEDTNG